ncbi:hypothetical protein Ancab_039506 [Ancistrocladus abbreviatus]
MHGFKQNPYEGSSSRMHGYGYFDGSSTSSSYGYNDPQQAQHRDLYPINFIPQGVELPQSSFESSSNPYPNAPPDPRNYGGREYGQSQHNNPEFVNYGTINYIENVYNSYYGYGCPNSGIGLGDSSFNPMEYQRIQNFGNEDDNNEVPPRRSFWW